MSIEHEDAALEKRHAPHNWEYADATARTAATGFTSGDVGKLARQLDDNSLWILADDSPVTWQEVGGGGALSYPILAPAGSSAAPTYSFDDLDALGNPYGMWATDGNDLDLSFAYSRIKLTTYALSIMGFTISFERNDGLVWWAIDHDGHLLANADNAYKLGDATHRPSESWAVKFGYVAGVYDFAGSGSPEGVVTANVGSTFRRTDGGAGTSFYVKESGTGNTGWVGK